MRNLLCLTLCAVGGPLTGQSLPLEADIRTLDGILTAYYEVVSGPAGEAADRARDHSIHYPGALVGITGADAEGTSVIRLMTLDEYHDGSGGVRNAPFFEWEIHRVTETFGNVTHVWSTYVTSDEEGGEPTSRGINSIQLYHDGDRWWVTSWIFDSEREGSTIPDRYLPEGNHP